MKKKNIIILCTVIISVLLIIMLIPAFLLALLYAHIPNIPEPEVTYAEFPFELVYKKGDEIITVNDVYVCEYKGVVLQAYSKKARKWEGYVKSVGDPDLDLVLAQEGDTYLVCTLDSPLYYMGDPENVTYEASEPTVIYVTKPNKMGGVSSGIDSGTLDPLIEKYGIDIISWEYSEPIENTYKVNNFKHTLPCILISAAILAVLAICITVCCLCNKKRPAEENSVPYVLIQE